MNKIYTIGHSTRPISEFIELLDKSSISQLVDIRTIPKSRYNPQFGQDELKLSLENAGIEYTYLKSLGGLRPSTKSSLNDAWHNKSFRNYADYMQTDGYRNGTEELTKIANNKVTAIMCAEAVPWRCHRSLVSDTLLTKGFSVCEIIGANNIREHSMTNFAVVSGNNITYPKSALEDNNDR